MRTKICKRCGKIFYTETGHYDRYLCQECARIASRESLYKERTCKICGASFMGYPHSLFCSTCGEERRKIRERKSAQKRPARHIGSTDHCMACGKEYTVNSGVQKYCPECSKTFAKEKRNAKKRIYQRNNYQKMVAHKKEMRSNTHVCVICGKVFDGTSATITCSPECAKELKRIRQREDNIKRKRSSPPQETNTIQSGIDGVTWDDKKEKWKSVYNGHYIGVYDTIEIAAGAIEAYKKSIKNK